MKKLNQNLVSVIASTLLLTLGMVAHGDPGAKKPLPDALLEVCTKLTVISPARYALAYIDVDADSVFDSSVDLLIAEITETSGDDVLSVGDTITTSSYPTSMAPCPDLGDSECPEVGSFLVRTVTIPKDWVVYDKTGADGERTVSVAAPSKKIEYSWFSATGFAEEYREDAWRYVWDSSVFLDNHAILGPLDELVVSRFSPSRPQTEVAPIDQASPHDDPFLNVEIY